MRIAIVVAVYNIVSFNPLEPNPGIGGTQYMSLCLAALLSTQYRVIILTDSELEMAGVEVKRASFIDDLLSDDVLIFSAVDFDESISASPARLIAWAHNTYEPKLDRIAKVAERIVVISGPQFDLLRWHTGAEKMVAIPYPFDISLFKYTERSHDYIVYLGALVPAKGFHHYANSAATFLENRTTVLYVIGGSATYGKSGGGRLGVASKEYENIFIDKLAKYVEGGQVKFLGNLGIERFELLRHAKLGLTNPTGSSETFCISNYELMSLGVPVVGGFHKGMTETLLDDKRLVLSNTRAIGMHLNRLLDDEDYLDKMRPIVRSYVDKKASRADVLSRWQALLERRPLKIPSLSKPILIDHKLPLFLASKMGLRMSFGDLEKWRARLSVYYHPSGR